MARTLRKLLLKPVASVRKWRHTLLGHGYSVERAYGNLFLIDWRHSIDKKVALHLFEHERIQFFMGLIERIQPVLFLDIGAHAALYSILAQSRIPSMEVHAFEPDLTNLCQLQANLFLNRLERRIRIHPFGLSSGAGTMRFEASDDHDLRGFRRISESGSRSIEVRRLDDVLDLRNTIVAAKIDVEGHECEVVSGARQFLASNRCLLQVESWDVNLAKLTADLRALGYRRIASMGDHYFTNLPDEAFS